MSTLVLTKKDVGGLLTMPSVIEAVEEAFRVWAEGKATMPPKSYLVVEQGDFRAMPAAIPGSVGLKWVNVHPQNPPLGLPTVMAILIYNKPDTGYPLAIMDATEITAYRTGAAAAIAAKYLARKNARTLGIIGAGRQAYTQLMAHVEVFQFGEIRIYDLSPAALERFIKSFPRYPVRATSIQEA
ncbi:MAG: ornithine cyclodeaminase family protein, partial [Chloroflexi bacterium]|nr:ornithine cyclodeaminase family protein [Chloroflexota bacterium]